MVARRTPNYEEGADPIEQSKVDRSGCEDRQNSDDSDGENLFAGHSITPPSTLDVQLLTLRANAVRRLCADSELLCEI